MGVDRASAGEAGNGGERREVGVRVPVSACLPLLLRINPYIIYALVSPLIVAVDTCGSLDTPRACN